MAAGVSALFRGSASLAPDDANRRRVNAEQVTQFTLDDLAEAREKLDALGERLEAAHEENREKRLALNTLKDRIGTAIDLVREGRASLAIAMMHDMVALAERGRVQR